MADKKEKQEVAQPANEESAEPKRRPGRPKGSKNKPKTPQYKRAPGRPLSDGRLKLEEQLRLWGVDDTQPPIYKCTCCGKLTTNPKTSFYITNWADWLSGNDRYSGICNECGQKFYERYTKQFDEKTALLFCCFITGKYFSEHLYEYMAAKGPVKLGEYFRVMNTTTYRGKNFFTYLIERRNSELFTAREEIHNMVEDKWKKGDKQNKNYVIQTVGYDPFEDETYSSADRKYMYNTLAAYLTEEVAEDPHKLICVVNITKSLWQIEKISLLVNMMIKSTNPDEDTIKQLISTKNSLQTSINTTARENAISASGSGKKNTSSNSISAIMRSMINDGYEDVKANSVDAQMTEAYQTVSAISIKALMNELNFTTDDYAKMVAEQSEVISSQSKRIMELEEQNRVLSAKAEGYGKKRKAVPVEEEEELPAWDEETLKAIGELE